MVAVARRDFFWSGLFVLIGWAVGVGAGGAQAQKPVSSDTTESALRVYLDCRTFRCEEDYVRRQVSFVDYVRDRRDGNVHVLVTTEPTGSGGTEFTLTFIGRKRFAGRTDTLTYAARETETREETRRGVVKVYKAGLMPFISRTSLLQQMEITAGEEAEEERTTPEEDPWNFWVYEVGANGYFQGEQRREQLSLRGDLEANRTTKAWKIDLNVDASYRTSSYQTRDQVLTDLRRSYSGSALVVKSLGDHWSVGASARARHSTYRNYDLAVRVAPALEYNVFPYEVSTRRQLRVLYEVWPAYFNYQERTIFNRWTETRLEEVLDVTLEMNEPWGSVTTSLEASHFFHDLTKNNLQLYSRLRLRLVRGLSLNLYGSASVIQNQLNLPAVDATTEEVLLRRRELATDYRYYGRVGISYQFGSIYNNIVNPRFGQGRR